MTSVVVLTSEADRGCWPKIDTAAVPTSGPWARRGAGQAPISGHPARAHGRFVPAYGPLTKGSVQVRLGDRTLIGCT